MIHLMNILPITPTLKQLGFTVDFTVYCKLDIETLYRQIHNQLAKEDRPKCTKQAN